jgi:holo-[acyl-carrier protein] synthase
MIGIGTDIQVISEFASLPNIRNPGVFFTDGELAHGLRSAAGSMSSLAGILAAKESLLKALRGRPLCCWLDIEVCHTENGAPTFRFHGPLAVWLAENRLRAHVSISHSGDYANAVVLLDKEN